MATIPQLGEVPRSLTQDAFCELFGRIEHAQLGFKRGVSTDVRDTIAAMAMSEGGLIVHGVDDQRHIVGCPLSQNTHASFPQADVDATLKQLVPRGLLRRVGNRGGSRYVLSDATIARAGTGPPGDRQNHRQTLLDHVRRRGSLSAITGCQSSTPWPARS